jgi:hypothetical protein
MKWKLKAIKENRTSQTHTETNDGRGWHYILGPCPSGLSGPRDIGDMYPSVFGTSCSISAGIGVFRALDQTSSTECRTWIHNRRIP